MIKLVIFTCMALSSVYAFSAPSEAKQEIIKLVKKISSQQGVDYRLILCVIKAESNFNQYAVSHKGAQGLMQIMPMTQKDLGITQPFSKHQNIKGGVYYLIKQIKKFGVRKGLWAYNTGAGNVSRGKVPLSTKKYANKIIRNYWKLYSRG